MSAADRPAGGRRAVVLLAAALSWVAGAAAQAQPATPERVATASAEIAAYAQRLVGEGETPGLAIAVVFRDEAVFLGGFGIREAGRSAPVTADTVFQLASLSKPLAATVVAALVGDGIVTWDTRVADIDPAFRLSDPDASARVTIADLFAHRSGLPGNAGNELEQLGFGRGEILHRLRLVPLATGFRAGYAYSNFGFTQGAVAAAKAAGMGWEDAAETRLYRWLGMTTTSSRHRDFLARDDRVALHARHEGRWQVLATRNPDAQSPAGGVSASARDLARWMRLELARGEFEGERMIDAAALGRAHQPAVALQRNPVTGAATSYGLGWTVEDGRYGRTLAHAGAFSVGARSLVRLIPSEGLGIAVLANAFPTGVPEAVAETFFDLVFTGRAGRDWLPEWNALFESLVDSVAAPAIAAFGSPRQSTAPERSAASYAGIYENAYMGRAVVTQAGETMMMRLGPDGAASFPLAHFDGDTFVYRPLPEMPEVPSAVTFRAGPDGMVREIVMQDFAEPELATLTRVGD